MPKEGQAKVLTKEEFKRVVRIAHSGNHGLRNVAILYSSFGLGLRAQEIALLKISDIFKEDFSLKEDVVLRRKITKGEKTRMVYLTNKNVRRAYIDYINERIKQQKQRKQRTLNFDSAFFKSQYDSYLTPNSMQRIFYQLFKLSGIESASGHSGRRTFATNLIESGVDINTVSKLLGHSRISTTAVYFQTNPERMKRVVADII